MVVAFSACQQHTLESEIQQNGIYTLIGEMSGGEAMSRAQIVLDNTDVGKESFMWNDGDAFTLYQEIDGTYTEHVYQISDYSEEGEGDKRQATFVTNNPVSSGEVIAVYPSGLEMKLDQGIMTVAIDFQKELDFSQKSVEEVWKDYFRNNMVMKAKATLSDGGENALYFEHLTSLARITYHNQSGKDQQVTDIELGGDQFYGFLMTVWFKYDIIGGNFGNGYKVTYKDLTVKAGESFDFYILFGPDDFREGDLHLYIHTTETDVDRSPLTLPSTTIAAANNGATKFEAGKRYWFKVTETEDGLIWTKDYNDVVTETVTIENTELSTALQACLGAENVTINSDGYAVMTKEFAASVTDLEISRKTQLLSLDGIEQLTNLQNLTCQFQQNITTLDFSGNVSLKFIDIQGCSGLQSLDLQSNVALEHLAFTYSKVTNLDLTKNVNLRYLAAYGNSNLVSMDISNCNKLTSLLVENTGLSSLTVNHPELLAELSYEGTALSLDLSQYTHLHTLFCSGKGSDFAKVTDELKARLNRLDCRNCGLTELDLTKYRNLGVLICSENHLTNLDLSAYSDFEYLCCGNQTDKNGKSIVLKLKLNENLYDEWSQWVKEDSGNTNVELQTVDPGNGNTGGSDFTIEGIY